MGSMTTGSVWQVVGRPGGTGVGESVSWLA